MEEESPAPVGGVAVTVGVEAELATPPEDKINHLLIGEAIAEHWAKRSTWILRKVDSVRLQEEHRGQRKVSLDLVVPADPRLSYESADRDRDIEQGKSPLVIPLAVLKKQGLRDLDMSLEGKSLPVLTSRENGIIATAAIVAGIVQAKTSDDYLTAWRWAEQAVQEESATTPTTPPAPIADPPAMPDSTTRLPQISDDGTELRETMRGSFLLLVLIPRDRAGKRIIVKYSSHWSRLLPEDDGRRGYRQLIHDLVRQAPAALGFRTLDLEVELDGPDDSESYHLEIHAPPSLVFTSLAMPKPEQPDPSPTLTAPALAKPSAPKSRDSQLVEGHGRYDLPCQEPAILAVAGANSGVRTVAWVVSLFCTVTFLGSRFLPGAFEVWTQDGNRPTAILLAVPAAAVAAMTRQQENTLAAYFWRPVRFLVMMCAVMLVAGASALAVGWRHLWLWNAQWIMSGSLAVVMFSALSLGIRAKMQLVSNPDR